VTPPRYSPAVCRTRGSDLRPAGGRLDGDYQRSFLKAFLKAGANVAAVGFGDRAYVKPFCEETGIRFPLLVDGDASWRESI
jgi:hypothetical protein